MESRILPSAKHPAHCHTCQAAAKSERDSLVDGGDFTLFWVHLGTRPKRSELLQLDLFRSSGEIFAYQRLTLGVHTHLSLTRSSQPPCLLAVSRGLFLLQPTLHPPATAPLCTYTPTTPQTHTQPSRPFPSPFTSQHHPTSSDSTFSTLFLVCSTE